MVEPPSILSVDEYLALERDSDVRHEYVHGEIFAMSGASRRHNRISWNIVAALAPQLRDGRCEGFVSDMRVQIPESHFTYPDVVIVCGEPKFRQDEDLETLLNPTMIVEVLSPSTEDYDRGRKFAAYRTIPSLQLYLLVSQDRAHAERFERQPGGMWTLSETDDIQAVLDLPAIGAQLAMADIYDRVPGF